MAINQIHESTMLSLAETFIQADNRRPYLEAHPPLVYFVDEFAKVAEALRAVTDAESSPQMDRVLTLRRRMASAVEKHDALIRQIYFVLEALAAETEIDRREQAAWLQTRLLPDMRLLVRYPIYRKVGEAKQADERLGNEERAVLRSIPVPAGTLLDLHDQRLAVAETLENAELELRMLEGEGRQAGLREARNRWMRLIRLLLATVEYLDLGPQANDVLLGHVQAASKAAGRRRRSRMETPAVANDAESEEENGTASPDGVGPPPGDGAPADTSPNGVGPPEDSAGVG